MSARTVTHSAQDLLDHEIVDSQGNACGMVDGLEIEGTGAQAHVAALLVGPGAWLPRLPALPRVVARWLLGERVVRIPIEAVSEVAETVKLVPGEESGEKEWGHS
jgi:sporulation protein YlmC with PRC-barrel domain